MSEDVVGDAGGLGPDPADADEPGFPGPEPGPIEFDDQPGCPCGASFSCFYDVEDCGIAKARIARQKAEEASRALAARTEGEYEPRLDPLIYHPDTTAPTGVWVVFERDYDTNDPDFCCCFADEVAALRTAVKNRWEVKFLEYGESL